MKRIVVTGATGFIGIHLIKEWLKEDTEIFAVVRSSSRNIERIPKNSRVHIIDCEMSNYNLLSDKIITADFFYHLAWEGARAPYRYDKELQKNNYEYSVLAMDAAKKLKCTFFLGSGSQAEYGSTNGIVDEEYPCNPNTAYGKEKLHACTKLWKIADEAKIKFIWTRIFSIYGVYDHNNTLIMDSLYKMKKNETIEMTEATQLWDYLYVEDAAKAMKLFAIKDCESGIYNIASGDHKPLKQFVQLMKVVIRSESKLKFGVISYGVNGLVNLTPNSEKVKKFLGWKPEVTFEEGIKRLAVNESSGKTI